METEATVSEFQNMLSARGVSRRSFMKLCGAVAVAAGLSELAAPRVAQALEKSVIGATKGKLYPVIWIEGASCTGCTESFAQVETPDAASIVLDMISLNYSETLSAAAGWSMEEAKEQTIEAGNYILVYEGAVLEGWGGQALRVADKPGTEHLIEAAEKANAVVALGSCAVNGGWMGAHPNQAGALGVQAFLKKAGINTPFNRCKFAIMNPELAATLPKYQIACGVTDIMMHTMERYFIPESQCEMTDEIAEGLLRTVIKNGPKVLENPSDYNAMAEIMWCGSLSHNGLTECGRGKDFSVHKFGHALSAKYDVAHGASLAAVWGAWAKYQYDEETVLWRFARFAEKVWGITEGSDHKRATEGIERTVAFFHSLSMPTSLHELDIPNPSDEDLRALSMDATQQDTVKLSRIRKLGAQEVYEIYQMAR